MIGRTLSHYQILQELDSSGMGVVYRHLPRHAFITDAKAIRNILSHLETRTTDSRAPP